LAPRAALALRAPAPACVAPILRPPASTPFPYTTLFRSLFDQGAHAVVDLAQADAQPYGHLALRQPWLVLQQRQQPVMRLFDYAGDRKSTRLNSSHVKISYAVFCWKKKTARTGARSPPHH